MILLFHLFVFATYGNDDFVNVSETSTSVDLSVQSSVWPDLAKLCHFATLAKYSESWAILRVYLLFAKILDQLWANFHWRANGQMLKNNLVIWSHWQSFPLYLSFYFAFHSLSSRSFHLVVKTSSSHIVRRRRRRAQFELRLLQTFFNPNLWRRQFGKIFVNL